MKVGYWTLLVAAVTLMAGPAWGQTEIDCFVMSPTDLEADGALTLTAYDAEGAQIDLAEWSGVESNFLDSEGERIWGFFVASGDVEEDGAVIFEPFTQEMLDCEGPDAEWDFYVFAEEPEFVDQYFAVVGGESGNDSVADLIAAGGTCAAVEPEEVLVFISGPHLVTEGQEVTLVGNVVGGEGTECGWTKDSGAIGDPGDMELDLGEVSGDDEGVYVFTCTVDDAPTPSEDFELMLVDAVPLAGGLGLGVLAGACALAGAVIVRRKK